jgi:hypothetical protein
MSQYQFVPYAYAGQTEPAYTQVFNDQRLVAIVRQPGQFGGERADHHRVDCDLTDYDPVGRGHLKAVVQHYLKDEKVSVFSHRNWKWLGKTSPPARAKMPARPNREAIVDPTSGLTCPECGLRFQPDMSIQITRPNTVRYDGLTAHCPDCCRRAAAFAPFAVSRTTRALTTTRRASGRCASARSGPAEERRRLPP